MSDDLTRRAVLRYSVGLGAVSCLAALLPGSTPVPVRWTEELRPEEGIWLRRREDMLSLRFHTRNIAITVEDGIASLTRIVNTEPAVVIVEFQPQHVLEEALKADPSARPIRSRVAGPSRLAFTVTEVLPYPFTTDALLDWSGWTPRLVEHAVTGATTAPRAPRDDETALELPWKLLLSPDEHAAWAHGRLPAASAGWTELWHTRLGVRAEGSGKPTVDEAARRVMRAVWLADERMAGWIGSGRPDTANDPQAPFLTAMGETDIALVNEHDIVRLSSDGRLHGSLPRPIQADQLMLTSLGAWYDLQGAWDKPEPGDNLRTDLAQWRQRGTMGRDHYVKIVKRFRLFPFKHRVVVIEITQREITPSTSHRAGVAFLRRRVFLVPLERDQVYAGDPAMPDGQRGMPFRRIAVLTDSAEVDTAPFVGSTSQSMVPMLAGAPFRVRFRGTDWAAREVDFACPVVLVSDQDADVPEFVAKVIDAYATRSDLNNTDLGAVKIAMAEPGAPGDTTVTVQRLYFGGTPPAATERAIPPGSAFFPAMHRCDIHLPEAAALAGRQLENVALQYFPGHLAPAPGANRIGLFLQAVDPAQAQRTAIQFATDRAGGLAKPESMIAGFARDLGPIPGAPKPGEVVDYLKEAAKGQFNTAQAFAGALGAKILGEIPLSAVLQAKQEAEHTARMVRRELEGPHRIESTLDWKPVLKSTDNKLFEADPARTVLEIHAKAVLTQQSTTVAAQYDIRGELRDFHLNIFGKDTPTHFITVEFVALKFTANQGAKPHVDCDIGNVAFRGALSWVQELSKYVSFGPTQRAAAARKPLNVDVDATGIRARLGLHFPSVPLGFITLTDVALLAGVTIPFTDNPVRVDFALSSREKPFHLTIYGLGGGGFVGLGVSGHGIELLEFCFEFGAAVALDVGVASGSVSLMAGILFHAEVTTANQTCRLAAYIRLNGALRVLGLITLSLEFYLDLTYNSDRGSLVGQARLTVSIEFAFFSKSVTLEVRRELAGSGSAAVTSRAGRPALSFGEVYGLDHWSRYQAAFTTAEG